jgi:hypothetical protein
LNGLRDYLFQSIADQSSKEADNNDNDDKDNTVDRLESIEALHISTLDEFRQIMRTQVNDPHYRFIANFLRSPMFFCHRGLLYSISKLFQGHFSPGNVNCKRSLLKERER